MKAFLAKLRKKVVIGVVGGSDLVKIEEQMDNTARTAFDFTFSENGLTAFQSGKELVGEVGCVWPCDCGCACVLVVVFCVFPFHWGVTWQSNCVNI